MDSGLLLQLPQQLAQWLSLAQQYDRAFSHPSYPYHGNSNSNNGSGSSSGSCVWEALSRQEEADGRALEVEADSDVHLAHPLSADYVLLPEAGAGAGAGVDVKDEMQIEAEAGEGKERNSRAPVGLMLSAECVELDSLQSWAEAALAAVPTHEAGAIAGADGVSFQLNLGLNVSNNALTDEAVGGEAVGGVLRRLQLLAIGGNQLSCVSVVTGSVGFSVASRQAAAAAAAGVDAGALGAGARIGILPTVLLPLAPPPLLRHLCFLKVLDLSFSEGLRVDTGCFLPCPLLRRLVLEGCGLKSTLHPEAKAATAKSAPIAAMAAIAAGGGEAEEAGYESDLAALEAEQEGGPTDARIVRTLAASVAAIASPSTAGVNANAGATAAAAALAALHARHAAHSIFSGLLSLRELRLSDNALGSYESLGGLACLPQLQALWIADNPVLVTGTRRAYVTNSLLPSVLGVPSLEHLDDVDLQQQKQPQPQSVARLSLADMTAGGGLAVSEDMEREFQMGLRGERDNSAVA